MVNFDCVFDFDTDGHIFYFSYFGKIGEGEWQIHIYLKMHAIYI